MINKLTIKIFDYIFSNSVGLKGDYFENVDNEQLCSELDGFISKVCDIYDFWHEYKFYFNDNCVVDASTLSGHQYIYNGFPKMKLSTKKDYLNYKVEQVRDSISDNGEFLQEEFELVTDNIINAGKKEILDYCKEVGIIEYIGKVFISASNDPAFGIIYGNIKAVLYTEKEIQSIISENVFVVSGNGNRFGNIEQNSNSKNNDEELFNIVLLKLELMEKEGISKSDLKLLEEACYKKEKKKVVSVLKDVAFGTISSLIATGILARFGIQ